MSLIEFISEDEYQKSVGVEAHASTDAVSPSPGHQRSDLPDVINPPLTYCEFCKGYYNEYHYGEPDAADN